MRPASNSLRRAQPHLGTLVEMRADGDRARDLQGAIDRAFGAIAAVHRLMSRHDPASDVGRLSLAAPGAVVLVHSWTWRVLRAGLALAHRSNGAFDLGATVALLPDHRVRVERTGTGLDLGGIAKGFAVDRALAVLRAAGATHAVVNAGGDLRVHGQARVHVRDPRDGRRLLGGLDLADRAIASSGGVIEGKSGTVIDPRTRTPPAGVLGASVCARSCLVADALTKIVMVAGPAAAAPLLARYRASALLVTVDGEVLVTPDWPAALERAAQSEIISH
jgi:thiamine biosynthesis lipoprotein